MSNDDTIDTLNDLIETCKDGEYGFTQIAERVKAPTLRSTLMNRADECRQATAELTAHIARLGGKADTDGSATGSLHRGWVSVKGAIGADSDLSMMEECERGEDSALARYRDAIKKDLPPDVASVVQRQYEGVKRNHDQIRTMRDTLKATKD